MTADTPAHLPIAACSTDRGGRGPNCGTMSRAVQGTMRKGIVFTPLLLDRRWSALSSSCFEGQNTSQPYCACPYSVADTTHFLMVPISFVGDYGVGLEAVQQLVAARDIVALARPEQQAH